MHILKLLTSVIFFPRLFVSKNDKQHPKVIWTSTYQNITTAKVIITHFQKMLKRSVISFAIHWVDVMFRLIGWNKRWLNLVSGLLIYTLDHQSITGPRTEGYIKSLLYFQQQSFWNIKTVSMNYCRCKTWNYIKFNIDQKQTKAFSKNVFKPHLALTWLKC